jgi:hypothetical protein
MVAGAGSTMCFYRPTDAVLVGVWMGDDTNTYCHGTSATLQAGEQPNGGSQSTMSVECWELDAQAPDGRSGPTVDAEAH